MHSRSRPLQLLKCAQRDRLLPLCRIARTNAFWPRLLGNAVRDQRHPEGCQRLLVCYQQFLVEVVHAQFLVKLDRRVPPVNSTEYSDAENRALLGLDNAYKVARAQVAANSKAVSKTWTMLLRFQVLDVFLATNTWPDRVAAFQSAWTNQVRKTAKESKRKARAQDNDHDPWVASDVDNVRLAATSDRKRTKARPLQLTVPELPCSRVIATALATTIGDVSESTAASVPDWSSLLTFEDSGAGLGGEQDSTRSAADPATPPAASSIAQTIRAPEHDIADVEDSLVDVERGNPLVPESASPDFNAKEGTSRKRPRSNSTLDTGMRTSKRPLTSAQITSGAKSQKRTKLNTTLSTCAVFDVVFRQGSSAESTVDSNARTDGTPEKAEKQVKSNKRKKPSKRRPVASRKRKPDSPSTSVVGPLSEVESMPPKISRQRVPMWGFRPDGSKREFKFQRWQRVVVTVRYTARWYGTAQ
ncbi:hypothetical protein B0H14DRAFT_2581447 [Mycena olivaceomarginata]|nr:hypothetical protein B0H14DRAFT_2581447 [Mycena olivaceomarginata]